MTDKMIHGDCVEVMRGFEANSFTAVVTDPPYGLEFMGKEWDKLGDGWRDGGGFSRPGIGQRDTAWTSFGGETANPSCRDCGGRRRGKKKCQCKSPNWHVRGQDYKPSERAAQRSLRMQEWHLSWSTEALLVLKPGGHLLAFGGTRTFHRLTCAIEDAGFEIRDCLMWLYGSGFPKSHDVSKAIDKAAGAEREVVGKSPTFRPATRGNSTEGFRDRRRTGNITTPATPEAQQWDGYGTALKPAWEPIILARKPLAGTVAGNIQEHGTGALNVDGCRIGVGHGKDGGRDGEASAERRYTEHVGTNFAASPGPRGGDPRGRWPANVILDEDAGAMLDDQAPLSGQAASLNGRNSDKTRTVFGKFEGPKDASFAPHDLPGSASRFFYCAKADKRERVGNHPTVKPLAVVEWLVKLVTMPEGTRILDPFAGSGSTGVMCGAGVEFVGIEKELEYVNAANERLRSLF